MTPCIGKCGMRNGLCKGCKRTIPEISGWGKKDVNERMALMKQLQGQTSTHNCPECNGPAYCAMEDGKSANLCWCMAVPATGRIPMGSDHCLCRTCLSKEST